LSRGSFRYSMVFGALFGLATGGLSDLHKTVSGFPPSYIQWISDKTAKKWYAPSSVDLLEYISLEVSNKTVG
jgi:hypothetical protein